MCSTPKHFPVYIEQTTFVPPVPVLHDRPCPASQYVEEEYEDEYETEVETELVVDNKILYQRGYPFYKMTPSHIRPRMNLFKTFSPELICNSSKYDILEVAEKVMKKKGWEPLNIKFGLALMTDAFQFAQKSGFNNVQKVCVLEIFFSCYTYLQLNPLITKDDVYKFFRRTLYLYGINDPPESLPIFYPIFLFTIAKRFYEIFVNHFELYQLITVPYYKLTTDLKRFYL